MTEQEIINYYGGSTVYKFKGTLDELNELQLSTGNSYNYIKVQETIYFTAQKPVDSVKATQLLGT